MTYQFRSLLILTVICLLLAISTQSAQQQTIQDSLQFKSLRILEQGKTINNGCGDFGTNQYQPNIAHDNEGNYLIVWVDNRAGKNQIYAQLYNDKDEKAGNTILVEDRPAYYWGLPALVYNKSTDEYLITWIENEQRVVIQRVKSDGTKVGNNITVFEKSGIYKSNIDVFQNGNLIITWFMNGWDFKAYDLYFCIADSSCKIIRNPELINKSIDVYSARIPTFNTVATDTLGNAVIVWNASYPPKLTTVYLQVINQDGNLIGEPMTVQDAQSASTSNYYPQIASTNDGTFLLTWTDYSNFWRKSFRIGGGFSETKMMATTTYDWRLASNKKDKFYLFSTKNNLSSVITFSKEGNQINGPDILNKLIGSRLNFIMEGYGINYAGISLFQNLFRSVYTIKNGNDYSIVKQKFSSDFNFIGEPTQIADDKCSAWQISPMVKYNKKGESIVIWTDTRNGRSDIYCQVYDVNNSPVGDNFMLNDPAVTIYDISQVVIDTEDNFVIAYRMNDANYSYYAQKISRSGGKIGSSYKFATSPMVFASYSFHNSENGEYLFLTMPQSSTLREIKVTKLNSNFNTVSKIDGFFKEKMKNSFDQLGYSINSRREILFTWIENHKKQNAVLKGIILSESGAIIKDTFVVAALNSKAMYKSASSSFDKDQNMAIVWNEYEYTTFYNYKFHIWRNYPGIKKIAYNIFPVPDEYYSSFINKYSNKKLFLTLYWKYGVKGLFINDNDSTLSAHSLHDFSESDLGLKYGYNSSNFGIDLYNNRLKLCYDSVKDPNKGYEIYQDLFALDEFDFTSVRNNQSIHNNSEVTVLAANPVRSTGIITYSLNKEMEVQIILYNILGERVKIIANSKQLPGKYTLQYYVGDLAAGVYFLRLNDSYTATKKILIVK